MRTAGPNQAPGDTIASLTDKARPPSQPPSSSPSTSNTAGEERENSPIGRGALPHGTPTTAKPRPLLLPFAAMYCILHFCTLFQMLSLWRSSSTPGHASSGASAAGYLALSLFKLLSLSFGIHCTHGLATMRFSEGQTSDSVLVIFSGLIPMLQVLLTLFHPPFLTTEKNWVATSAVLMSATISLGGIPPAHSLMQLLVSSTCFTALHCYSHGWKQHCPDSSWGFLACFLSQQLVIGGTGLAAGVTTYVLAMKASALSTRIRSQAETMTSQEHAGGAGSGSASAGKQQQQADGSGSGRESAEEAGGSGSKQGEAAGAIPASGPRTALPFESWGLRWAPAAAGALQRLEQALNAFAVAVNEQKLVWLVCVPVVTYSFVYCVLVRMKFQGASYCNMSSDAFMLYMMTWFMVGRSSSNVDVIPVMLQFQASMSASLARAAQQPSLAELVDRLRHLVTGGTAAAQASAQLGHQITVTELLGEGTFGKVYKGVWRGTLVAVKRMTLPASFNKSERRERMAIMEAAISSALVHPNLVQTYSYSVKPARDSGSSGCSREIHVGDTIDDMAAAQGDGSGRDLKGSSSSASSASAQGLEVELVLEYMDCGTLRDVLDQGRFETASPSQHGPAVETVNYYAVLETAADVAKGMVHLHSLNVIHSDLKARNVLLRSCASDPRSFTAKVGDFGLSLKLDASDGCVDSLFHGTPTHMAPEALLHGRQSKAADVYAFGITMWELYTGRRPYQDVNRGLLRYHVAQQGHRPRFPAHAPDAYTDLAARCWDEDPEARPSFEEVVDCLTELLAAESGGRVPVPVTVLGAVLVGAVQVTTSGGPPVDAAPMQPATSAAAAARNPTLPAPAPAPRVFAFKRGPDGSCSARTQQPGTLQEPAAAAAGDSSSGWGGKGMSDVLIRTAVDEAAADRRPSPAALVSALPASCPVAAAGRGSSNETQPLSANWHDGLGFISEQGRNPRNPRNPTENESAGGMENTEAGSELPSGVVLGGDGSTLYSQL